jgi:tetratricopeptide (TPR) repeat protein
LGVVSFDLSLAALQRRAARLLREGPLDEAIEAHRQLLDASPGLADGWYNLAYLQRCARRYRDALHSYGQALDHDVDLPEEVHVNRSVILAEYLGRQDEAAAELDAALALNPDYLPALLNLAVHHEDRGDAQGARAVYQRIRAVDPANARALARLAAIAPPEGPDGPAISALRDALAAPGLGWDDKAELGFALGQALDAAQAYEAAFAAFDAANHASRMSAPADSRYDAAATEQLIDRIIAAFPAPPPSRQMAGDPPLFICGLFRSGSTLVEQILASHSQVTAGGELEILPALAAQLQPYPEAVAAAGADAARSWALAYLDELRAIHPEAGLVTDKRPDNFLHIGLIKTIFPNARIVHTVRAPLDNLLSVYFQHFQHNLPYATQLADIVHWRGQYERLMAHWRTLFTDDIVDVSYEELVAEPRATVERLLGFCGLAWEEGCLSFHASQRVVKTASVWQVRRPLYRGSVGRWRNYRAQLERAGIMVAGQRKGAG